MGCFFSFKSVLYLIDSVNVFLNTRHGLVSLAVIIAACIRFRSTLTQNPLSSTKPVLGMSTQYLSMQLGNDFLVPSSLLLLGHACSCAVPALYFCVSGVSLQHSICVCYHTGGRREWCGAGDMSWWVWIWQVWAKGSARVNEGFGWSTRTRHPKTTRVNSEVKTKHWL